MSVIFFLHLDLKSKLMVVITLTKNSSLTIKDTIESIKAQKFKKILWLIFDERSKDETLNIIKDCNINFKFFYSNSNSIYDCFNKALRVIKKQKINDVIFFLHSDDVIYNKNVFYYVNDFFKKYKIDILYGNIFYFRNKNKVSFRKWDASFKEKQNSVKKSLFALKKFAKKDFIRGWMFPHTSLFFHSRILDKISFYDTQYKISADYLWSLKLLLNNNLKIFYWNNYIVKMRYGGTSTNFKNIINVLIEDYKILYNLYKGSFFKIILVIFTLISKKIRKIRQFI